MHLQGYTMSGNVGVVIVTFNSRRYVEGCIGSLMRQTYRDFDMVVVDNGSTDGTIEELKRFGVHVISNRENMGFAAASNIGAEYAFGKLGCGCVLLLNPDTEADKDLIKELLATLDERGGMAVVQGKLFLMGERELLNTAGNRLHYLYFGYCEGFKQRDTYPHDREIGYASGACMMMSRELMSRLGYLFPDEFFMYHEDTDLCMRARLMGFGSVLSAKAVAWHDYRFGSSGGKFYHMEKNRLYLLIQNYRAGTLALLLPAVVFTELQVMLYAAMNGWFGWKLRSYGWFFKNMGKVMERRRAVQASRTVSDLGAMGGMVTDISFREVDNPGLRYITNPVLKYYFKFVTAVLALAGEARAAKAGQ